MKKVLSLFVLATVLLTLGFASADILPPVCATYQTTFVSGTITDQGTGLPVEGASVSVECNGYLGSATSGSDGGYSVEFNATDCTNGDKVVVQASYDGLNGESNDVTWYSRNTQVGCMQLIVDVACRDIPMVPEFGLIAGITTVLGALGTFFVVRKK